jgi:hypothetical protein
VLCRYEQCEAKGCRKGQRGATAKPRSTSITSFLTLPLPCLAESAGPGYLLSNAAATGEEEEEEEDEEERGGAGVPDGPWKRMWRLGHLQRGEREEDEGLTTWYS